MKAQTPSLPPEIQALRQSIADVAKRQGVESIRLFGSALQGLERARDVDLVIDPMPPSFAARKGGLQSSRTNVPSKQTLASRDEIFAPL